jgi:uncharacterized protein (DUF433 family)
MTDERGNLLERIVLDPDVLNGKPSIRGSRVPVSLILNLLGHGNTFQQILEDYPYLTEPDIRAALAYAEARMNAEEVRVLAS